MGRFYPRAMGRDRDGGHALLPFHDARYLREVMGLKRAPEFEAWLEKMKIVGPDMG